MQKKILVAIDHSKNNQSVFESAISLAKATDARIMLLHVLTENEAGYPILPTYAYYPMIDDEDLAVYQEKLAEYKKLSLDLLQSFTQQAKEAGIATEYNQLTGNPGRTICEFADNWQADLVIVGSRGLKGLKEMFLGSVSNYVTHHTPCSILVVRSQITETSDAEVSK